MFAERIYYIRRPSVSDSCRVKALKMAANQAQGLKSFILSHPPLVVFTICVFLFGVTTITLAFIVGRSELPNPDITMDWNVFLSHLSQRSLCVDVGNLTEYKKSRIKSVKNIPTTKNGTAVNSTVSAPVEAIMGVEELSLSELLPDISSLKLGQQRRGPTINVTKSMVVPLSFDASLLRLPPMVSWLKGKVTGRHVGYTGELSKEIILVNMFFPRDFNRKKEMKRCQGKEDCHTKLNVCMVFFGPSTVIPKTRQLPGCRHWSNDVKRSANTSWHLLEYVSKECIGQTPLKVKYEHNPNLTIMLTSMDRNIVNLHLMHTSYLIFIIVITMLCYALIKSHFRNAKLLALEKVNV